MTLAARALCSFFELHDEFEVVHDDREEADFSVMLLGAGPERNLEAVGRRAAAGRLLVIGPVEFAAEALRLGVAGYVTPEAHPDELLTVTRSIGAGRKGLSPDVTEFLIASSGVTPLRASDLTSRQREVLLRLTAGEPVVEIAHRLGVTRQAVSQILERLRNRAGVHSNRDLVRYARDHALLATLDGALPARD